MSVSVFDDVRRLVSARAAAECYGFTPNRGGYIPCPFHNEKTASLKLYDDGGWYCFGCHAGGDSINFVAKLLDISPMEAVRRMNEDFRLSLPLDKPASKAQQRAIEHRRELAEVQKAFEDWRGGLIDRLNAAYRTGYLSLRDLTSLDGLTEGEALAVKWLESLEHWSDCLSSGSMEEQMTVFRERRAVGELCGKILHHTLTKYGAA